METLMKQNVIRGSGRIRGCAPGASLSNALLSNSLVTTENIVRICNIWSNRDVYKRQHTHTHTEVQKPLQINQSDLYFWQQQNKFKKKMFLLVFKLFPLTFYRCRCQSTFGPIRSRCQSVLQSLDVKTIFLQVWRRM